MFWLPDKTIFVGPRKQRGNIVFTTGLAPSRLVDVTGDYVDTGLPSGAGGWSLIQEWQTILGELTSIDDTFQASGGRCRGGTVWWTADGGKLTLSSSSSDNTKVFICSTPFDPSTASEIFSYGVVNPKWGSYNRGGSRWVENKIVGDEYVMYTANDYVITNGTPIVDNRITKADAGFNSSSDAPAIFAPDFSYMLWYGRHNTTGDGLRNISTPNADLGSFIIVDQGNQALDINSSPFSNFDKTETIFMRGEGSPGVSFNQLDNPRDVDNYTEGAPQSLSGRGSDIRPQAIWFDPDDTRTVWIVDDPTSNFRMALYATNVPESL